MDPVLTESIMVTGKVFGGVGHQLEGDRHGQLGIRVPHDEVPILGGDSESCDGDNTRCLGQYLRS